MATQHLSWETLVKKYPGFHEQVIPCPNGHQDTYIVKDEKFIQENGILLACNVCEDFYPLNLV